MIKSLVFEGRVGLWDMHKQINGIAKNVYESIILESVGKTDWRG